MDDTTPLKLPTKSTLSRYGLTLKEWLGLSPVQVCAVCDRCPKGQLVVDHQHVKNWRHLPPTLRKLYVRGKLCHRCNFRFLAPGLTAQLAIRIAAYLTAYDLRRPNLPIAKPKKKKKRVRKL